MTTFSNSTVTVTFATNPERPSFETRYLQEELESAADEQLGCDYLAKEKEFALRWLAMSQANRDSLKSFFRAVNGLADSWTVTYADGTTATVRFSRPIDSGRYRCAGIIETTVYLKAA